MFSRRAWICVLCSKHVWSRYYPRLGLAQRVRLGSFGYDTKLCQAVCLIGTYACAAVYAVVHVLGRMSCSTRIVLCVYVPGFIMHVPLAA